MLSCTSRNGQLQNALHRPVARHTDQVESTVNPVGVVQRVRDQRDCGRGEERHPTQVDYELRGARGSLLPQVLGDDGCGGHVQRTSQTNDTYVRPRPVGAAPEGQ